MADRVDRQPEPERARARAAFSRWWPVALLGLVVLVYGGFAGLAWWIRIDVHKTAAVATREFPGDEVEALLAYVQSDEHGLSDRNRAVWALGQIGDRRALPVLEHFYTGRECQHSRFLCQKELRKAIDKCNGRNGPPRWLPFLPRPRS